MRRPGNDASRYKSIGSLLESMRGNAAIREGIERARVLEAFPGIAEAVLGQKASANCRAVQVTDYAILVEVTDSIWGQRIQLSSRALLAALREAGAPPGVARLRARPDAASIYGQSGSSKGGRLAGRALRAMRWDEQ